MNQWPPLLWNLWVFPFISVQLWKLTTIKEPWNLLFIWILLSCINSLLIHFDQLLHINSSLVGFNLVQFQRRLNQSKLKNCQCAAIGSLAAKSGEKERLQLLLPPYKSLYFTGAGQLPETTALHSHLTPFPFNPYRNSYRRGKIQHTHGRVGRAPLNFDSLAQ